MSLFDYPRINVKGTIQLNPGTANNDDYAASLTMTQEWGPFAGQPFGLIDSKLVEARTYGMSDEAFIAWAQKPQMFDSNQPPSPQAQLPAEWNYYGAMDSQILEAKVTGAQTGPGKEDASLLGADLAFSGGHFTDVNSEGSPPGTQFFIDRLTLTKGGQTLLSGSPSKGACQWLNFYRNANLQADGGAGGYVYHVIRKGPGTTINLPGFEAADVVGVIFRYYLYSPLGGPKDNAAMVANYEQKKTSPKILAIAGTFAPLYAHETILTTPVGRLMVSNTPQIPTPPGTRNNGGGLLALAPAVLAQNGNVLSADFIGTFPDYYQGNNQFNPNPDMEPNPKLDFGDVSLVVTSGGTPVTIGPVDYADTAAGDAKGWIFDFDVASNAAAQQALSDPDAVFTLVHPTLGTVLAETDYYFVSNQQAIYGEQHGPETEFLNQGTTEPLTVSVYHRGQELPARPPCP